jgi:ankyrin repeat protein
VPAGDRNGSTAVHLAVAHRAPTLETVRLLLLRAVDQAQNLLAATDTNGSTPQPVAVARSDASWELVQNRIEQPDAARCMDQKGFTPLHVAALNDAPRDVLYLLAKMVPEAAYNGRLACGMLE